MKLSENQGDYEPLRTWALHPSFIRPAGLAQLLCGGMITWLHTAQPLPVASLHERPGSQMGPRVTTSLSLLVAAMIAEVIR